MMRMNALVLVLLGAGCLIQSGCGHGPPAADKNVIVLVIDTLRRDRLGAFGFDGKISSCMDELAVDGFCFRKAFAPSSWTKPSVASLLTGLYPGRHGAVGCPTFLTGLGDLKENHRTLAEYLKEAGYVTAAMVTNPHIVPKYHFDQGFDEFVEPAGNAEALLDKAVEWIRGHAGAQRTFLYLHIFDPHMPYAPPAPYQKKYAKIDPGAGSLFSRQGSPLGIQFWVEQYDGWRKTGSGGQFQFDYLMLKNELQKNFPGMDVEKIAARIRLDFSGLDDPVLLKRKEYLTSLYHGEVAFCDDALRGFMETLESSGILDDTLLVVTSDHGEAFLEHDLWGHGADVHAEQVDVPLIFRCPGSDGPLRGTSEETVGLADVLPTILDLLGLPLPDDLDGVSLWPAMEGQGKAELPDRPVFSEVFRENGEQVAAVAMGMKVVRIRDNVGALSWQAYNLFQDPQELNPLDPDQAGETTRGLKRAIEARIGERSLDFKSKAAESTLSEEERRKLKALGY